MGRDHDEEIARLPRLALPALKIFRKNVRRILTSKVFGLRSCPNLVPLFFKYRQEFLLRTREAAADLSQRPKAGSAGDLRPCQRVKHRELDPVRSDLRQTRLAAQWHDTPRHLCCSAGDISASFHLGIFPVGLFPMAVKQDTPAGVPGCGGAQSGLPKNASHRPSSTRRDVTKGHAAPPRRRPIRPRLPFKFREAVAHARLLRFCIEARRAQDAPAVEHDDLPRFLGLNPVADRVAPAALAAGVVVCRDYSYPRPVALASPQNGKGRAWLLSANAALGSGSSPDNCRAA